MPADFMQWFYSKNNAQHGPVSLEELRNKIATGDVESTDLVWKEGMGDWTPVAKIAELASPGTAQTEAVSPPPPVPAYQQTPYQSPARMEVSPGESIPNYLWQSILVTILCCWPLGIPAIVFAAKVDKLKASGQIAEARAASAAAKKWTIIALVSGLVAIAIYIGITVLNFVHMQNQQNQIRGEYEQRIELPAPR